MKKKLIKGRFLKPCLAISIFLICVNLPAQQAAVRLTPEQAVEMAIKSNLGLESARTGLATKKRASDLSWNQFIPSVTVTGAYTFNNENTTTTISGVEGINEIAPGVFDYVFPYSATFDNPRWNFAIPIQVSLTLSMAMFENMNRLRLDYETGVINFEKAKLQMERDVRKAYHNMLLLQENIELLRGSFTNVQRQVQMAQANYNAGLVPELTYLQAQVSLENMRPMIDQAENGMRLSMAQFAMFLGMDFDTQFELIPVAENVDFIPFDVSEMIKQAASGKPDIMELRHTILMLESARKTQSNSLLPFLNISWGHTSYYTPPIDVMGQTMGGEWGRSGALTIALGIRINSLLPWSADTQAIKNLDEQIRMANIGLAQLVNGTEIEIYNTILALDRTRISAQAQAQTVRLAEQAFRLTEQAYQAGLQDYFQVQNAQQSLHQARVQMLEQQFNYINGLIDLEYSIGVPFGTLSRGVSNE